MNKLTTMNNDAINSYEFLQVINGFRVEAGENETRNDQFLERVIDGLDISNCKTFAVKNNRGNKDIQVVNLTKDEMMLVGMRESKVVRRKVLGYIKSLESKLLPSYQIINPVERARAWANEYETHVKEIEYKDEQIEELKCKVKFLTIQAIEKYKQDPRRQLLNMIINDIIKCRGYAIDDQSGHGLVWGEFDAEMFDHIDIHLGKMARDTPVLGKKGKPLKGKHATRPDLIMEMGCIKLALIVAKGLK